jgi:hypothetical protein
VNQLHIALAKDNSSPPNWGQFKDPHLGVSAQSRKALIFNDYLISIWKALKTISPKTYQILKKAKKDGDAGK